MNNTQVRDVETAVRRFIRWLDQYGETSYDHQSYFASGLARSAKALYYRKPLWGTLAVSPMIFSEAFLPGARRFFWKRQRFPIADAHYAMGFAFLAAIKEEESYLKRAVHFLKVLEQTRCKGFRHYAWGYPFNWETRNGTLKQGTPMITTVPYVYEAFRQVYELDHDPQRLDVMRSIAQHALEDYQDFQLSPGVSTCSYCPSKDDSRGVINASAYRAFLLTRAAVDFSDEKYQKVAERNLNFVIESQNPDGSWFYSIDKTRDFVDHFHTCFVLKALAKIEPLTGSSQCREAIERGVKYYVRNLFDSAGFPKPFSKRPRLTVYKRELYDYAECINLGALLSGQFPEFDGVWSMALSDLLLRWQKSDGSFQARELMVGWDNVPMHRWAQSQVFRSLTFFLAENLATQQEANSRGSLDSVPSKITN